VTCNVLMRDVAQLASVQAERNSLREDLVNYRTSKRHADSSWRAERDKAERLEKELAFYQAQSARAMADRDKACPLPQPPPQSCQRPGLPGDLAQGRLQAVPLCQPRCTHALGLRLQAAWEAEELRSRSLGLEERARRAEGQTEAERARRLEAERALQSSREREAALQVRRHACRRWPRPRSVALLVSIVGAGRLSCTCSTKVKLCRAACSTGERV